MGENEVARRDPRFIGAEIYRHSSFGVRHPLRIPRVSTVIDLARALGWLPGESYITSPRAKPAALHAFHTRDYVAALQRAEAEGHVSDETRLRHGLGTPSNPVYPEMFRRPATAAGGSLLAGELLARPGIVHHPAGGTHHGMPDRAGGFCYLNDPVLAILSLRRHGIGRIAYIDIDAHHPDGVEAAFADDPEVMLISVHEERRWPFTGAIEDRGAGNVWNLPVPAQFNDTGMQAALEEMILPLASDHRPAAIVLQCGADAVTEDPLSRLALSNNAHCALAGALAGLAPRLLVLGGGGYNPWSVARCWTSVWGTLCGHEVPDRLPQQAEAILRALSWTGRLDMERPESWFTTLRDAPRPGPLGAEVRTRLATHRARRRAWV